MNDKTRIDALYEWTYKIKDFITQEIEKLNVQIKQIKDEHEELIAQMKTYVDLRTNPKVLKKFLKDDEDKKNMSKVQQQKV